MIHLYLDSAYEVRYSAGYADAQFRMDDASADYQLREYLSSLLFFHVFTMHYNTVRNFCIV